LTSLVPGSGAEKAGLQRGDTIIEFNGNSIAEYIDVTKLLRECKAGDHVEIKARRGGKTLGFDVVMGVWE
jgi:S1-C subfamily serine protease